MTVRQLPLLVVLAAAAAVARAQAPAPPATEAPKAPKGWKYIAAKDGSYQFLFPTDTTRQGSLEKSFQRGDLRRRSQRNYCVLRDGTLMTISVADLDGAALQGLKVRQVYDILIDADKEGGSEVSEPPDIMLGQLKAKEYVVTKGRSIRRVVLSVGKGRVYQLSVAAGNKAHTTSETADTFLKSLTVGTKEAPDKEGDKDPSKGESRPLGR
jgi:hypothetical protein